MEKSPLCPLGSEGQIPASAADFCSPEGGHQMFPLQLAQMEQRAGIDGHCWALPGSHQKGQHGISSEPGVQ